MEKYYSDFIARQTRFVSPLETFRPSAEKSPETPYQSALLRGTRADVQPGSVNPTLSANPHHGDGPTSYEIQEEATMLELIEELKRDETRKTAPGTPAE
jgi:hypothetical protein